jgi:hypothetical protein
LYLCRIGPTLEALTEFTYKYGAKWLKHLYLKPFEIPSSPPNQTSNTLSRCRALSNSTLVSPTSQPQHTDPSSRALSAARSITPTYPKTSKSAFELTASTNSPSFRKCAGITFATRVGDRLQRTLTSHFSWRSPDGSEIPSPVKE